MIRNYTRRSTLRGSETLGKAHVETNATEHETVDEYGRKEKKSNCCFAAGQAWNVQQGEGTNEKAVDNYPLPTKRWSIVTPA